MEVAGHDTMREVNLEVVEVQAYTRSLSVELRHQSYAMAVSASRAAPEPRQLLHPSFNFATERVGVEIPQRAPDSVPTHCLSTQPASVICTPSAHPPSPTAPRSKSDSPYPTFNTRHAPLSIHTHNVRIPYHKTSRRARIRREGAIHHNRQQCIQDGHICRRAPGRRKDLEESGRQGCQQAVLEGVFAFIGWWLTLC